MTAAGLIAIAAILTIVVGPLLVAVVGRLRAPRVPLPARDWSLTLCSTLAFALAFNLTFFIQELFLVLPKALTPGLSPTLFHNNHTWQGSNPLENLFQGTGALATLMSAAVCAALLERGRGRTMASRLVLIWMTYCGIFMALPQVVVGAVSEASDVGRAMAYLGLGSGMKLIAALSALLTMPWLAMWLSRHLLGLEPQRATNANGRSRSRWMLQAATLPAIAGCLLIFPYRVPREWIEVVAVPIAVALAGIPWMQAGAWRTTVTRDPPSGRTSSGWLWVAALTLLAVFHLVLRRGVEF